MANRSFTVHYEPRKHWNTSNPKMKAYDVFVDGIRVGHIERAVESTDRRYNRIRIPGKGRLVWAWQRLDGRRNSPGLYEHTRAAAVKRLTD